MKTEEIKQQLTEVMIGSLQMPDTVHVEKLLRQLPAEELPQVMLLVKSCSEFADSERCCCFTVNRGATHRRNCRIVSDVLQKMAL